MTDKHPERALMNMYMEQVNNTKLLSAGEELELFKKYKNKNDKLAKEKLLKANLKLVVKVVKEKKYYEISKLHFMDLIQEGNIGLMKAIEKFNINANNKFSTYAHFWIIQSIERFCQNNIRMIRLPVYQEELVTKIKRAKEEFTSSNLGEPTIKNYVDITGLTIVQVKKALKIINTVTPKSINEDLNNEDLNNEDLNNEDYNFDSRICNKYRPDNECIINLLKEDVRNLFDVLSDKEKVVIESRYAFLGPKLTLHETSTLVKTSTENVRQIELKAIKKLKKYSEKMKNYFK